MEEEARNLESGTVFSNWKRLLTVYAKKLPKDKLQEYKDLAERWNDQGPPAEVQQK